MNKLLVYLVLILSPVILASNMQLDPDGVIYASSSLEFSLEPQRSGIYFGAVGRNGQSIVYSTLEAGSHITRILDQAGKVLRSIESELRLVNAVISPDNSLVALCYGEAQGSAELFKKCDLHYIDENTPENTEAIYSASHIYENEIFFNTSTDELTNYFTFLEYSFNENCFYVIRLTIVNGGILKNDNLGKLTSPFCVTNGGHIHENKITIIQRGDNSQQLIKTNFFIDNNHLNKTYRYA